MKMKMYFLQMISRNKCLVSFLVPVFFYLEFELLFNSQSPSLLAAKKSSPSFVLVLVAWSLPASVPTLRKMLIMVCSRMQVSASVISAPVGGWRRRYFKVLDLFLNLVISERDLCSGGLEVVLVVGYVWSCRYQTGGRYLLIDLDTENEPTGSVTLTVLLIIIIWSRETFLPSSRPNSL